MSGRRFITLCAASFLIAGGGGGIAIIGSSDAGAVSTTHSLTLKGPGGSAVEGQTRATFTCDSATGKFRVSVSGVQVIQPDHFSTWGGDPAFGSTKYGLLWRLLASSLDQGDFALVQNTTSGLYNGKTSGLLADRTQCTTGATVDIADETGCTLCTHEWLFLTGLLP
jgi:hypothetical protein